MRIRLMLVLLAILLILSLVFLSACAPTAASSTEPTETALPADLPVMTKIWITPECYQAHPENAVYNAQGARLCTDGATMEVLEAEGPDINGMSSQRLPDTRQLRFVLTGGSGWVNVQCEQLFFHLNVEFTSETVEILVTANEVQVVGEGMSYDVSYQISSETQLRLNSLRGEDETCVHLTWGEDGLHVSTVQTSKLAIEDMMGEPREMPPGGFVIKYPNSVVD